MMENDDDDRKTIRKYIMWPVKYPQIMDLIMKMQEVQWSSGSIEMYRDRHGFLSFSPRYQQLIMDVLSFFVVSDNIVIENVAQLGSYFEDEPEVKALLSLQTTQELIHTLTYNKMIIGLMEEKESVIAQNFKAIESMRFVQKKINFCRRWFNDQSSIAEIIMASIIFEGLMFQGSFHFIEYICKIHSSLPGLLSANRYIRRDENIHVEGYKCLYRIFIREPLPHKQVFEMFQDALSIELEFWQEVYLERGEPIENFSLDIIQTYVRMVANTLLEDLSIPPVYRFPIDNPTIANSIALNYNCRGKSNFFEVENANYTLINCNNFNSNIQDYNFDEEF